MAVSAACLPRLRAAKPKRQRLSFRPRLERLLRSSSRHLAARAPWRRWRRATSASSITVSCGDADQPAQLDQRRLADVRGFDQLRALARALRLEARHFVRRNQADVEAVARVGHLRLGARGGFLEHAHGFPAR